MFTSKLGIFFHLLSYVLYYPRDRPFSVYTFCKCSMTLSTSAISLVAVVVPSLVEVVVTVFKTITC